MKRRNKRSIITKKTCGIHFHKHNGTWYTLDSISCPEGKLYLMESVQRGKDAPRLLVDEYGVILASGCCNSLEAEYDSYAYSNDTAMSLQPL